MGDSSPGNREVQQIVERLLKLQEENRRKIRPGETKSAPSTPTTEQRGAPRSLSRHDTFIVARGQPAHPATHLATPTHNHLPYLHPLPAHCPTPQSYQPMDIKGTNFIKNNRNSEKQNNPGMNDGNLAAPFQKNGHSKYGFKLSYSKSMVDLSHLPNRGLFPKKRASLSTGYLKSNTEEEYRLLPDLKIRTVIGRSSGSSSESPEGQTRPERSKSQSTSNSDRLSDANSFETCFLPDDDNGVFLTDEKELITDMPYIQRKHGLKHLSRSTPSMSPSGSPQHSESEGPARISRRTKKFLRQFRNVPSTERVINYYACAIVSDILLQGTLYITDNYFAFYSNIFGYVNKTLIPIDNVANIRKEKTAKFIPNAVGLQTFDGETFVFSSLISRDATFKFMVHMWRKSRKLTDSDIESTIHGVREEICLDESGSNSADSAMEDCVDFPDASHPRSSLAHQNATVWSKSSPVIVPGSFSAEASVSYTENNSSNTTPETCISTASFNEVRNTVGVISTSASENDVTSGRKEGFCPKVHRSNIRSATEDEENMQWIVRTEVVRSAVNIGIAPFRAVKESLQEFTVLPGRSFLMLMSSSLIVCLLVSAAFMVYRVESLNNQLNSNAFHHGDLYEEVLHMQQKLHAATAEEIEKTLNHQIRQLVTVKQSLEALIFLLNTDHTGTSSHIQETTY